jgi:hypothetical protein
MLAADRGPVNEGMAVPPDVGGEHADLAIGDPAGRVGVPAATPAEDRALFRKADLIQHLHRVRQHRQRIVAHDIPRRSRIPPSTPESTFWFRPKWPSARTMSLLIRIEPIVRQSDAGDLKGESVRVWGS